MDNEAVPEPGNERAAFEPDTDEAGTDDAPDVRNDPVPEEAQ